MSGIMSMLLGAVSSAAAAVDEFFNRVTLLLPGNGTNGAQNNTFLDSSSNAFAITRNGNTTQGSFTPFSQAPGYWGNFFDGSSKLNIGSSTPETVLQLASSDFTVEAWVYTTSSSAAWQYVISNLNNSVGNLSWSVRFYGSTGVISFLWGTSTSYLGNVEYTSSAGAVVPNAWTHIAVTRSGSSFKIYANGIQVGTGTSATAIYSQTQQFTIGSTIDNADRMNGYISNLRITKGGVLYAANFTPSTTPLTTTVSAGSVSALTCQSNRFVDNSSNALAITVGGGTPSVQAFSPFAPQFQWTPSVIGGSGYFDGTGDWLTVPSNTALTFSTGVFTLEFWAYCTNFSSATRSWLSNRNGTETNRWGIDSSTSGTFYLYGNGGFVVTSAAVAPNQWVHVCVTRANTSTNGVRIFINGRLDAVGTSATDFAADIVSIGASPSGSQPSIGYIANARIIKGSIPTDYQTSSTTTGTQIFTPPSAPSTTTSQGATSSNVSLLTNFTNAGIYDGTMKNNLETVGNAQVSTAVVKYGSGSMYFDGTGDYLQVGPSQLLNLGASDFTIEFWIYPTSFASTSYPMYSTTARAKSDVLAFEVSTGGVIVAYITASGGGAWSIVSAGNIGTLTLNAWNHVALVRNGSNFRGYVGGVQGGMTTSSASAVSSFDGFSIGSYVAAGFFTGYIDDLRISRYARYTAAFTPPTSAFALQ